MLNHVKKLLIIFATMCLVNCTETTNNSHSYLSKSKSILNDTEYRNVFSMITDSISLWVRNKLWSVESEYTYSYKLDSLLCFNKKGDRFISCSHLYMNIDDANSDGLKAFYGEKINSKWYFFTGDYTVIPRSMVKGHDVTKPLSYEQLHEIALKEVYSGYLDDNGEINEEWFTKQFENVGWCADCKTKEDYQMSRLKGVGVKWLNRDTTQPIQPLNKTSIP